MTSQRCAPAVQTRSVLTCPECDHAEELEMPTDACQFFHECEACHALLRPLPGDCCVFCSFGSVKCPPIQQGQLDCCSARAAPSASQSER